MVVVVAVSSLVRIWGECVTIHSPPALNFFFFNHLFGLNNPTKFQVNWIRTQNFQLKLFNIAVTLKYSQVTEVV